MSPRLKTCETLALKLEPSERALLAERLIASLDALDDAEMERLWVDEAVSRFEAHQKGKIPARSAKAVLRDARTALR